MVTRTCRPVTSAEFGPLEDPSTRAAQADERPNAAAPGAPEGLLSAIRTRVFSGLLLALPIAITIWIIYWLYSTLQGFLLDPIAHLINSYTIAGEARQDLPFWWDRVVAPLVSIALVLVFLYFLGHLVH